MSIGKELLRKARNNCVAVIGDGAITGGMAYEAMNCANYLNTRMFVVLNDNGQVSLPTGTPSAGGTKPAGELSAYTSRLLTSKPFKDFRDVAKQARERTCELRASAMKLRRSLSLPQVSVDFDLMVPNNADAFHAFDAMRDAFGAGEVFQYTLLVAGGGDAGGGDATAGAWSEEGFGVAADALERVLDASDWGVNVASVAGHVTDANVTDHRGAAALVLTSFRQADYAVRACAGDGDAPGCTDDARSLAYLHESTVSSDGRALTATLTLVVDPYSPDGEAWYRAAARACRRARESNAGWRVHLARGASNSIDAKDAVYAKFPLVVGGTLATVFALMGLSFRSLVAPLRSVATLVLTSSFVFGLCVLTYQRGGVGDDAQALSPSGACSRTSAARSTSSACARSAARPTAASCAGSRPSCASRSSSGSGSTTTSSSSRASTSSGSAATSTTRPRSRASTRRATSSPRRASS